MRRATLLGLLAATALFGSEALAGDKKPPITRERGLTFSFTGAPERFRVPAGVTSIDATVCGAQGGASAAVDPPLPSAFAAPGLGGQAASHVAVVPGDDISVRVGGAGDADGGYNGGGRSPLGPFFVEGAGGGGATDVRVGGDGLGDRVIVGAGGGGGGGGVPTIAPVDIALLVGGAGGGLVGGDSFSAAGGQGGTQTAGGRAGVGTGGSPGELGRGGDAPQGTGAGGGGLHGGGGGAIGIGYGGGGGGGSSLGDETSVGVCEGHGWAVLSWVEPLSILPLGVLADEPDAPAIVHARVELSFAVDEPVSVAWRTVDTLKEPGLAEAGTDFTPASGVLTFAPGQTVGFVPVELLPDEAVDPDLLWGEWGIIEFHSPSGAVIDDTAFFGAALFVIVDIEN